MTARRWTAVVTMAVGAGLLGEIPAAQQSQARGWRADYVRLRAAEVTIRALSGPSEHPLESQDWLFMRPIVGGSIAAATDNPFQVALLDATKSDNRKAQFCGGTLYTPDAVITAAHCVDGVSPSEVQVLTGTRKLDGTGTRYDVSSIEIHKQFDAATNNYDVAVLRLSKGAPLAGSVTLANADGTAGDTLKATGWGQTATGTFPADLMTVKIPLVDRADCNDANSYNGAITDAMLCAGYTQGAKAACVADSGGPLTGGSSFSELRGIVSWGGCGKANLFGVYTRISHQKIRDFIIDKSK